MIQLEASDAGSYNGTTNVDIVVAPATGKRRIVNLLDIISYNEDTVQHTFNLFFTDGTTIVKLEKDVLTAADQVRMTTTIKAIVVLDTTSKKIYGTIDAAHTTTAPKFLATYMEIS